MALPGEAQLVAELAAQIQAGIMSSKDGIAYYSDGETAYDLARNFYDRAKEDYPSAQPVTANKVGRQANPLIP